MRNLALLVMVAALPAFADVTAPGAGGGNARRHVLTADEARQCALSLGPAEYFTPSAKELERLERALPAWLGTVGGKPSAAMQRVRERLAGDHIWYFGQVEKGRRVIEVRGFCAEIFERGRHDKDKCPPLIEDRGDCIWYLRWDLARGTFEGFHTNGLA